MKSTLTSKGQITIPVKIREKLRLHAGDVLEFDETTPFLKATKRIAPEAWEHVGDGWSDPLPGEPTEVVLDEWRGPVELPKPSGE